MERPEADPTHSSAATEFFYFPACGEEAHRWLAELEEPRNRDLRSTLALALRRLRAQQLRAGVELLGEAARDLESAPLRSPSIDRFLRRYLAAASAYLDYVRGDLDAALDRLAEADGAIRWLIERHEFLVPLAIHCTDFIIQRARIARRANDWEGVRRQLRTVRSVCEGSLPYCVLASGRPVALRDVEAYFATLDLDEGGRGRAARFLRGELSPAEVTERIAERIFALPDMVIPYP